MKILFWVLLYLSIGFGVSLALFIYDVRTNKEWYKYYKIDGDDAAAVIGVTTVWPVMVVIGIFILLGKFVTKLLIKIEGDVNSDD